MRGSASMAAPAYFSAGADHAGRLPANLWFCSLTVGMLAGIAFLAFPKIDLVVSGTFHNAGGTFLGQSLGWVQQLRNIFRFVFYLCIAASLAGLFMTRNRTRTWLRLAFRQWLFLAICIAMGPGIVANVIFKDHWGRARPKHIVAFGGIKAFTPPLTPSNQCARSCSFVSGEAASIFVPFYAAGLLVPQCSAVLFTAGTLLDVATGLVRVSQGAHYLSDVIFAGVFMGLTVVLAYWAVFGRVPIKGPLGVLTPPLAEQQGIE